MHTVKSCKKQGRSLIVLKHPPYLSGHPKTCGNDQLEKLANTVFENNDDVDRVKIEMNRVRIELVGDQDKKRGKHIDSIQTTLDLREWKHESSHF